MKSAPILGLSAAILFAFGGCRDGAEREARSQAAPAQLLVAGESLSALHPLPFAFTEEGQPLYREDGTFHLQDYAAALNALSILATVSRPSEYGHPAYQPDWSPQVMWRFAEQWLGLIHQSQSMFMAGGQVFTRVRPTPEGWMPTGGAELSVFPHLAYAYHIHHRSGRFSDNPDLENRLNREATVFLVMPGRYLLQERFSEGRFNHANGEVDRHSMSHALGGLHGTAYAWVSWAKPEGAEEMGLLAEDYLASFLGVRPAELVTIYRSVDDFLRQHWSEDRAIYVFGEADAEWDLDAIGALLRGKKAMGDVLYMFGDSSDKERAMDVFARTAAIMDAVFPLARDWGMPNTVIFGADGAHAASNTVDLFNWYQFLNHLGGGYAVDREREGTARFFRNHRRDLLDAWSKLADQSLKGVLQYHLSERGHLLRRVSYTDGRPLDDQLTLATMGMFITMAGNIYGKGTAFASPRTWDEVDAEVAERSRRLFDLSFAHWALLND